MATTVYFVRHAHSTWVPGRERERPLSEQGRRDAETLARALADLPLDAVVSSPYRRAVETVEPLAADRGLAVELVEDLRERTLADPQTVDLSGAIDRVWDDPSFAHPGGESNEVARSRLGAAFETVLADHEGETVAVGTHGNALALLLGRYGDYGLDFWRTLTMPDVYRGEFDDGDLRSLARDLPAALR